MSDSNALDEFCSADSVDAARGFARLYVLHQANLLAWLRGQFGLGEEDCKDAAQQAWINAFFKRQGFCSDHSRRHFKAWLFAIAANEAKQILRRKGRGRGDLPQGSSAPDSEPPLSGSANQTGARTELGLPIDPPDPAAASPAATAGEVPLLQGAKLVVADSRLKLCLDRLRRFKEDWYHAFVSLVHPPDELQKYLDDSEIDRQELSRRRYDAKQHLKVCMNGAAP